MNPAPPRPNGYYPFIDYSPGGGLGGTIRATEANLAKDHKQYDRNSRPRPDRRQTQLILYRHLLTTVREKVATMKKQGRSLAEIVAAKSTVATDVKWGGGFIGPQQSVGLAHQGA